MEVNGGSSNSSMDPTGNAYTVEPPQIHTVTPSAGPTAGGIRITLVGRGFGSPSESVSRNIVVGAAMCGKIRVVSDTQMSCELPPGPAAGIVDLTVLIDAEKAIPPGAPNELPFQYQTINIASITPDSFPVWKAQDVVLTGTQLARFDVRPAECTEKDDLDPCGDGCDLVTATDTAPCSSQNPLCKRA